MKTVFRHTETHSGLTGGLDWKTIFRFHTYELFLQPWKKKELVGTVKIVEVPIRDDITLLAESYSLEMETVVDELFDEEGDPYDRMLKGCTHFLFLETIKLTPQYYEKGGFGHTLMTKTLKELPSIPHVLGLYCSPIHPGYPVSQYTDAERETLTPSIQRFYNTYHFSYAMDNKLVMYRRS